MRRAGCGFQRQASTTCLAANARRRSLSLGGGAPLELAVPARYAVPVVVGPCPIKGHCASERPLFFGAHPWCNVPAALSNAKPEPLITRRTRRRSLSLGRRCSTRACCTRAPCRAGFGRSTSFGRALRCREASLLRRAPVVRRASCGLQRQASAACRAAHARRRSLSLGGGRTTRAHCARAMPCWLWLAHALSKDTALAKGLSPSVRVCGATCQLRRPTPNQGRLSRSARTGARCLWGGGAALELAVYARHAVLIVVDQCPSGGHCAVERPLSFGTRPSYDAPAAASNAKPAPHVVRRTRARAHCLWAGGAPHERAVRARHAVLVVIDLCPL